MAKQIKPGDSDYRQAQKTLEDIYGPSPDKQHGWHFYPVRQASTGAHVILTYEEEGKAPLIGLIRRGGDVEESGKISATFGGFVDVPHEEQPEDAACREAWEESGKLLRLTPDRLKLVQVEINYNEVKHWHADHATTTISFTARLTKAEYEELQNFQPDGETTEVLFVPAVKVQTMADDFAYPHEFTAACKVAQRLMEGK